jgi:hypothetical protein
MRCGSSPIRTYCASSRTARQTNGSATSQPWPRG